MSGGPQASIATLDDPANDPVVKMRCNMILPNHMNHVVVYKHAILWLCKNAPELNDSQISKLVGSTKGTVSLIRKRSYWNFSSLKPRDPVILALCTQEAFQNALDKAKRRVEREKKARIREEKKAQAASL